MTIRSGTLADEDACVELWLAALERRDGFAPPPSSRERARAKFRQPIVRLGIAEGATSSTGSIAADSLPAAGFALTARATDETALLELIAVADGAAGRGTGGALLDDAITAAAASGYRQLALGVRHGNSRAEALYVSRGFVATGEVEAHPLGGEPMLQFRRSLA